MRQYTPYTYLSTGAKPRQARTPGSLLSSHVVARLAALTGLGDVAAFCTYVLADQIKYTWDPDDS